MKLSEEEKAALTWAIETKWPLGRQLEAERVATISALASRLMAENADLERIFKLQHSRTVKADKLWQVAHSKPLTFPDLGELIDWLLERAEKAEALLAMARGTFHGQNQRGG